ncbi:imm11 family protein [Shewanella woodyi]|uniref:imm11 family protein n=1 Tax=Shewanella woodyi TaxID=60961 RepID=UPI003749A7C1
MLDSLDIINIDYYEVDLINVKNGDCRNYYIANIIGTFECVNYDNSEVELWPNGKIEQIDSLAFIDTSKMELPPIFRLSSFLPLVIINDAIKQAFERERVTGFKFYKPEDFYL